MAPRVIESDEEFEGLRAALARRHPIFGAFVMIPRVEIVELLGRVGFDAAIFDLEHGPMEISDLVELAAAARGAGVHSVARMARNDTADIGRALDTGVDGILVPHVGTGAAAEHVAAAGRFPPTGHRSLNPFTRGTGYGMDEGTLRDAADRRVALLAMLEGDEALSSVDEICASEQLDAAFVGPVDLSASMGVPGQPEHPKVISAVSDVFARIRAAGSAAAVYAHTPEAAARWSAEGATFIALSADVAMLQRGFASFLDAARDPQRATAEQV